MARYTRKSYKRSANSRSGSRGRSYSRSYSRSAARGGVRRAASGRAQRVEVVLRHVMQGPGGDPGYMPGVPGTVGIANVPKATKPKKTF